VGVHVRLELLLVIQNGTIAAVRWRSRGCGSDVARARWSCGLAPEDRAFGERAGAIIVIALLTAANLRGLDMGKLLQTLSPARNFSPMPEPPWVDVLYDRIGG